MKWYESLPPTQMSDSSGVLKIHPEHSFMSLVYLQHATSHGWTQLRLAPQGPPRRKPRSAPLCVCDRVGASDGVGVWVISCWGNSLTDTVASRLWSEAWPGANNERVQASPGSWGEYVNKQIHNQINKWALFQMSDEVEIMQRMPRWIFWKYAKTVHFQN